MDYSSYFLINTIIWFFGTITMKSESPWVHPTFTVLLLLSIVINIVFLLTKKDATKREKFSIMVYSILSLSYLICDRMDIV